MTDSATNPITQNDLTLPTLDPAVLTADPSVSPSVPTDSQASTPPAADGKSPSPLDVLDQILNDAQSKAKAAEEVKKQEEAKKIEEELERQRQEDAVKVQAQIEELQTVKESPQYQAMVNQHQEQVQQKEDHQKKMDGMEIVQLQHTKL